MNNKRATRRALLTSITALVMCVVMLAGTTFAWFTDTATASVNKIQAGTLKVDIVDATAEAKSLEGQTLKWVKAEGATSEEKTNVLWEPGATYRTEGFKIKSTGSLALKYKIALSGVTGNSELLKVITFSVVKASGTSYEEISIDDFEGHLTAGAESSDTLYIQGYMDKSAGNTYQGKKLDGIGITVYATQDTVEYDSNNKDYGDKAEYPYPVYPEGITEDSFTESNVAAYVDSNGDVKYANTVNSAISAAINAGASSIYLKEDSQVEDSRTPDVSKSLTIYANGADLQYKEFSINGTNNGKDHTSDGVSLTIYDARNIRIWGYAPSTESSVDVTLVNCTYEGSGVGPQDKTNAGIFYVCIREDSNEETMGTVNLTMTGCRVSGCNQGVYTNANGTIKITDCAFANCATGIKASHKTTSGTLTVDVSDTTFDECGWTTDVDGASWLTEDSAAIKCKTKSSDGIQLNLANVSVTDTIGDYSFHIDDDKNTNKYTGSTTVTAKNVTVNGNGWTYSTT